MEFHPPLLQGATWANPAADEGSGQRATRPACYLNASHPPITHYSPTTGKCLLVSGLVILTQRLSRARLKGWENESRIGCGPRWSR